MRSTIAKRIPSIPPHDPETPLEQLGWIRRPQITAMSRLGIERLRDLIEHYPRRYEDRRRFHHFPKEESELPCCLCGTVGKTLLRRFGRMRNFEAELEEASDSPTGGRMTLRWFNLFHVQKTVLTGSRLVAYGRPRLRGRRLCMEQPEFEIFDPDAEALDVWQNSTQQSIHLERVVPIHPAGEGINTRVIRKLIHRALFEVDWTRWINPLPEREITWSTALQSIHFPAEPEGAESARRELALREMLGIQVLVTDRRNKMRKPRGSPKRTSGLLLEKFLAALPFALTGAQICSIDTIRSDMAQDHRMRRLLQGDVGSGKTVVAAAAMLAAIEAGHHGILMAPTQILAEQHFRNFCSWFEPLGIAVKLLTGSNRQSAQPLLTSNSTGSAVIGTHALLHHQGALAEAGLVVIDEQHKFGVLQRARIAAGPSSPDLLVMTATPIPRTLAQTVYGDLDLSILDEHPPRRGNLRTVVRSADKLPAIIEYLRQQLANGSQAYVVYPQIEESAPLSETTTKASKAAEKEFKAWQERLAPYACALLHGRLNSEDKKKTMEPFAAGSIHVLVATTVIEVGIDVPNATFLLVENAERFGLAQLHQLRGRIGRGSKTSTCVLLEGSGNPSALECLLILEKSADGFAIAEEDLRLRGAGDILGTAQSGLPPLRIADLSRDADLITVAASAALWVLRDDPELAQPLHAPLLQLRLAHEGELTATSG